ncbi:hypothetical protein V5O48_015042 [Marasmius crinis-equi]|uniref:Uncharacterized protein n=1 Tax=Marasmius crinis-equi TaxID=585013 RepID=A0ABR3EVN2_9AGAR
MSTTAAVTSSTVNLRNPGNAMMIAPVVIENAHRDTSGGMTYSKVFVMDGQVWLSDQVQLVAYFRFWNSTNVKFPEVGKFMMCAKMGPGADLFDGSLDPAEYHFVGDIQWIVPLPENANMCMEPWIMASGTVSEVNDQRAQFDIVTNQYTTVFRSQQRIPLHATIPDSPRYKGKKPMPRESGFVQVSGWMKSVSWGNAASDHSEPPVDVFHVEVVDITFFPASADIPSNATGGTPGNSPNKKRSLKFGYGNSPNKKSRLENTPTLVAPPRHEAPESVTHSSLLIQEPQRGASTAPLTIRLPPSNTQLPQQRSQSQEGEVVVLEEEDITADEHSATPPRTQRNRRNQGGK